MEYDGLIRSGLIDRMRNTGMIDKSDRNIITSEETLKEFGEWYVEHYGYKPTREQTFEMVEHYIGKKPKIIK